MALTDNVIAVYEFNESSGTTAADATGGGKTITAFNGPTFVAGKLGNAADIERGSLQFFTRNDTAFSIGGNMTVSAWVNLESYGGAGGDGIALYTTNESEGDWSLVTVGDLPALYHRRTGGSWGYVSGSYALPSAALPALGNWTHLVARDNGGTITLWVNGVSVSTSSFIGDGGGWGQQNFCIGQFYPSDPWNVDGKIDQVAIWARAISDSEIGQLYNGGAGLAYTSWGGGGAALTKAVADPISLGENVAKSLAISKSVADPLTLSESVVPLLAAALTKSVADPLSLGELVTPVLTADTRPTYFGSASVPADNTTNATSTLTITPPASMLPGDLAVVICQSRASATWSIGVTGGQSWNTEAAFQGSTLPFCRIFWCRFDGTWAANPRFDSTSATATSAIMHVFRPYNTGRVWTIDVAQATTQFAAPTTPFTVTRNGLTTAHADAITLACWHTGDDNTWGTLTGAGWVLTGAAQYRNTSSTGQSATFAHHIDAASGSVVPNVSKNQATLGGDAGVTAIIAWYAAPGALTKSLSDVVTMSDLRSEVAAYARSLPDPMSLSEVLDRLATYLRSQVDSLTLGDNVAAVRALMRSLLDPLTVGENLAVIKALLRSYSDAIILGELVDRQLMLAAYSDDFNRADSASLGANWTEVVGGMAISGNILIFLNGNLVSNLAMWNHPVGITQYQKATLVYGSAGALLTFMFRATGNTGEGYAISFDKNSDEVSWWRYSNIATGAGAQQVGTNQVLAGGIANGVVVGVTIEGLGNNTVVRIWRNPTGLPTRANDWDGDTTPTMTLTSNPLTPADTGTRIGVYAYMDNDNGAGMDNWFGGGCLESTGVLWTRDLFDNLVLGEALATLATLFRLNVDPITLAEVMDRAAALQRYAMDTLTVGENVLKLRALARQYIDTLTLGEALAKAAGKRYADAMTLGEAFTKQLQAARALVDPITAGEALAKAAQFRRSLADLLALGENLTIPLAGSKTVADALTVGEAITRVAAFSRSLADSVALGEALSRRINRALADAITLSEALAKAAAFNRPRVDPITLGEAVAKQKQIGKALSDALAMGEVLTKIFVGIKTLADPLVLGETVNRQLQQGLTKSLSDLISMAAILTKELRALRADALSINEVVAKQMQFNRAMANAMTLGEALQKMVVLVRSISNAMTLGEAFLKSAAYARARADALALSEAVGKAITAARSFADTVTVADALAKSMTFRRSMADLMTLSDTGTRKLLRQLLADTLTIGELVVTLKTFFGSISNPITMSDSVTKLFVLLRTFGDGLSLGENVSRISAFHRLRADLISLGEAFAKTATYQRAAIDLLSLAEVFNRIATYKRSAADVLDLDEAFQAARLLIQSKSDAIMLSDVVDTTMVIGTLATDRAEHRLIHGRISSRIN